MEITPEMRAAVLAETAADCSHIYDLSQIAPARVAAADGVPRTYFGAADPVQLPHIRCTACRQVWLVIDEPGRDYDTATELLAQRFDVATDDARVGPRWTADGPLELVKDAAVPPAVEPTHDHSEAS